MKKLILYLFLVCCFKTLNAQTECDNNVGTNYLNPTNNALPINVPSKFLNGTDWLPIDANGFLEDFELINMSFAGVPLTEMTSIRTVNTLPYYSYLSQGPLPINENGWELLLINIGRFPDYVTPIVSGNDFSALPYIVIYNRYSGIIRVFANFGLDATVGNGADAVEVTIGFKDIPNTNIGLSGLMRLYEGHDQALDQTTDVKKMTSIAKATNEQKKWFSTDFQVTYDPCTCYFPSELQISFRQIKTQSLTLHGRAITLPGEVLIDNNNQVNALSYLTGFDYSGNTADGGVLMYKSIQTMIDDYYAKLKKYNQDLVDVDIHNKKVKKNLALLNLAKWVYAFGAAGGISSTDILGEELAGSMAQELAATESTGLTANEIYSSYFGMSSINWFDVVKDEYEDVVDEEEKIDTKKLFDYVKQIFGEKGSTFISENFEAKAIPTGPAKPTASFTEMHFEGQITETLDKSGPTFYNPGTYGSVGTGSPTLDNPHRYPVYNDVLGSFALLKSPKIKLTERIKPSTIENTIHQKSFVGGSGTIQLNLMRYQTWTREYQFQLTEDLKFALNSNLDIKNYNISAAFNIVANPARLDAVSQHVAQSALIECYLDKEVHANANSSNFDFSIYDPIETRGNPFGYYNLNPNFFNLYSYWTCPNSGGGLILLPEPSDYTACVYTPGPVFVHQRKQLDFISEFVPIDAFYPSITSVGLRNESRSLSQPNLFFISNDDQFQQIGFELDCSEDPCQWIHTNLNDPIINLPYSVDMESQGFKLNFEVELKLIVDIEFNTPNEYGVTNKSTQIYTYEIRPEDIEYVNNSVILDNLEMNEINLSQYPKNIVLNDVAFNENTQIEGCKFYSFAPTGPNLLECKAWNDIKINGNLTSNSTEPLIIEIKAGNEVIMSNESSIENNITLLIDPILDYSHPMPKADQAYVTSFCGTNTQPSAYKANGETRSSMVDENNNSNNSDSSTSLSSVQFGCNVFPNPSSGNFTLKFNKELQSSEIKIIDLTGRNVEFQILENNSNLINLSLTNANSGIYTISIQTNEGNIIKRIIVN